MDLLQTLYLTQTMHVISDAMKVPVVVILLLLIIYAVYTIGSLLVELFVERKRYSAKVPELVARIEEAAPEELAGVVESAGLLRSQEDDLAELLNYLYLPEDGRTEVAKRLLANERGMWLKAVNRNDAASKVGPMLGLMGTLIPLGPGLVALGSGDTQVLSASLQFAFDTTVAGLIVAVVCFLSARIRRRWYTDYLVSMEAAFNALLEKGRIMHESGYAFEKSVWRYDSMGKVARKVALCDAGEASADGDKGE